MKKNVFLKQNGGLILLFLIFCFMYLLNCITPLLTDDYFVSFVWPEGLRINGLLPEDAKRVSSLSDVYDSLKSYYFIWGGRIPGQTLMTLFAWWGKDLFNVVNSFMATLLIMEIYWLSHEGKVSLTFDCKYIFWIFFAFWTFNMSFVDTFMWLSGSCEYLWMMVLLLAFLLPYVQSYYDRQWHKSDTMIFTIGMFILGMIVGCSREMLICWVILVLLYWLWICKKTNNLHYWKIAGLIGLCAGYAILIFAPGNFARLASDSHTDSIFIISIPILVYKLIFTSIIFLFHFILWHFIATFFIRQQNIQKEIKKSSLIACKSVTMAKISALLALGTMILLFLIMYAGGRPSFVTLVFLIISAALLFRAEEMSGVEIINALTKTFLKTVGIIYFIITVVISFYWNYYNSKQWDSILQDIQIDYRTFGSVVLNEISMPYPAEKKQLVETINMYISNSAEIWYGAHVIKMPVFYEGCYYNIIIPKYYGFKGINTINSHSKE